MFYNLRPFLASGKAKFVLCDFNLSIRFPPDTPPEARVLPALESEYGSSEFHPPDAANGETVYDPFAYDVACLGGLLCEVIGVRTGSIKSLAVCPHLHLCSISRLLCLLSLLSLIA